MTALSVNLNKVALLRNSRGGRQPDPAGVAERVLDRGAPGLTLHWREDERHTREEDVRALSALAKRRGAEFNLEGDLRKAIVDIACELQVTQCTLVPVTPGEVTSDHGWRLPDDLPQLTPAIARLKAAGVRVSVFVDAAPQPFDALRAAGVDRVEIYTEPYAAAFAQGDVHAAMTATVRCGEAAAAAGLGVNAGHDLNLHNLPPLVQALPVLQEVSIGHALIVDALALGFEEAVDAYLAAAAGRAPAPRYRLFYA